MVLKERKTLITKIKTRYGFVSLLYFLALISFLTLFQDNTLAHDGHDHGDESKKEVVVSNKNEVVRTLRVDDYEIAIKHLLLTPDKETNLRLFLTRFDTNTPIEKAKVSLEIKSSDGITQEIFLTEANTAGMYEGKFPPLREGEIKLSVNGSVGNSSLKGNFGSIQITQQAIENPTSITAWAKRLLIALGLFVGIFFAVIVFLIFKNARRTKIEKEAIA